jgi:hypothetical protein
MILLCLMGLLLHAFAGMTWGETFWAMVWTAVVWTVIDFVRDRDARRWYPRRTPQLPPPETGEKEK